MKLLRYWKLGLAAVAMIAVTVFSIYVPKLLPPRASKFKGILFGHDNFRKHACSLFLGYKGDFIDSEYPTASLVPGRTYALLARCRKGGFFHARLIVGDTVASYFAIPVGPWSDSQPMRNQADTTLTITIPDDGNTMAINYGFTLAPLSVAETKILSERATNWADRNLGLMWAREASVAVGVAGDLPKQASDRPKIETHPRGPASSLELARESGRRSWRTSLDP
jgi:hypothetical protein